MTMLSAQSIRRRCAAEGGAAWYPTLSMISPFAERQVHPPTGMSFGLSSCGYDVRVGDALTYPNNDCVYGARRGVPYAEYAEMSNGAVHVKLGSPEQMVVPPRSFVLAATMERFYLPHDVVMTVRDKSSWARQGIFLQNTVAEPGWRGWLTLEISNDSSRPVIVTPGCPIAQVMFELLDEPTEQPYPESGKYQDQAAGPQAHRREPT